MAGPEQTYCDWCYSTLTEQDYSRSRALGFDKIQAWACARCISTGRIKSEAPGGWDRPWPPIEP